VALACALAVVSAAGCGDGGADGEAQRGGTLRVAAVDLTSLDPAHADEPAEVLAAEMLFTPLVGLDPRSHEPRPALATRWHANDEQTRFRFTLRRGAEFSNGAAVTAQDAKATLDRVAEKATASPLAALLAPVVGYAEAHDAGTADGLAGVRALDRRTLEVSLTTPYSILPAVLATPGLGVIDADSTADVGTEPVGSGPFRFVRRRGTTWRLARAEGRATPRVDAVELVVFDTDRRARRAVATGAADVVQLGTEDPVPARSRVRRGPYLATGFYALDLDDPKFADPRFRQAIVRALDGPALAAAAYGPAGLPARGLVPAGVPGGPRNQCRDLCDHDLAAAKALVREAFPEGNVPSVAIDYDESPTQAALARDAVAQLATAGIPAVARPHSDATYADFLVNGDPDVFRFGIVAAFASEDAFLDPWFVPGSPENVAGVAAPDVVARLAAARRAGRPGPRATAYAAAARAVLEAQAVVPVVQFTTRYATSPRVRDLDVDPFGGFDPRTVWLDRE
jgi:ABC-type oligopeptide transport system substrate-binding subunit